MQGVNIFFSFLHPSMRETTISQSPHNRQLNPKRAKFPTTKTKALINQPPQILKQPGRSEGAPHLNSPSDALHRQLLMDPQKKLNIFGKWAYRPPWAVYCLVIFFPSMRQLAINLIHRNNDKELSFEPSYYLVNRRGLFFNSGRS